MGLPLISPKLLVECYIWLQKWLDIYADLSKSTHRMWLISLVKELGLIRFSIQIQMNGTIASPMAHYCISSFYPRPVLAFGNIVIACVCVSVSVCAYQSLACPHDNSSPVQARITKFRSEVQNTSLLFWGAIDLDLQGQIWLRNLNLPHFELVRTVTSHLLKLESPNLHQRCKTVWLRSLLFWGLIDVDLHVNSEFWNPSFLPNLFVPFLYHI